MSLSLYPFLAKRKARKALTSFEKKKGHDQRVSLSLWTRFSCNRPHGNFTISNPLNRQFSIFIFYKGNTTVERANWFGFPSTKQIRSDSWLMFWPPGIASTDSTSLACFPKPSRIRLSKLPGFLSPVAVSAGKFIGQSSKSRSYSATHRTCGTTPWCSPP